MRRKAAPKRYLLPDPKHNSELLAKFINHLMIGGKKPVAERIVYGALEEAEKRLKDKSLDGTEGDSGEGGSGGSSSTGKPRALEILNVAFKNVRPAVEVRSRRVGGATYQVPVEVRNVRSSSLAMRWIIAAAKARNEKSMTLRLAGELVDACEGRGNAVRKRDDTHRMAKANQAFAHYRW